MKPTKQQPSLESVDDYRKLLLSVLGSLTLCDHMGDVADTAKEVLNRMGIAIEWDDLDDLGTKLGKLGVQTLYGTELSSDDGE